MTMLGMDVGDCGAADGGVGVMIVVGGVGLVVTGADVGLGGSGASGVVDVLVVGGFDIDVDDEPQDHPTLLTC